MSSEPFILAIVGSANERLAAASFYDPEVVDLPQACRAAEDLGRQAALAGWHLQVYSLHKDFIEYDLVRGYADPEVGTQENKKIYVHFAQGGEAPNPIPEASRIFGCAMEGVPYSNKRWEVAFYRPLSTVSALVVIGGGKATLATGIVALALRIPLYAIATFGGSSKVVWQAIEIDHDLPNRQQYHHMGNPWMGDESARNCLEGLRQQIATRAAEEQAKVQSHEDRAREERERLQREQQQAERAAREADEKLHRSRRAQRHAQTLHSLISLMALIATLMCLYQWQAPAPYLSPWASLLLGAVFAGITGSSTLGVIRWFKLPEEPTSFYSEVASLLPGATAGVIASLIFVSGHVTTLPDDVLDSLKLEQIRRMIPFVVMISFVAGLTWNRFFSRLRESDLPANLPDGKG